MAKIVYVEWLDSYMIDGPDDEDDILKARPVAMRSAGILLSEDGDCVRIVQDQHVIEGTNRIRRALIIPKTAITKVELFGT